MNMPCTMACKAGGHCACLHGGSAGMGRSLAGIPLMHMHALLRTLNVCDVRPVHVGVPPSPLDDQMLGALYVHASKVCVCIQQ
jgi:hypothetical protein